MSSQNLLSRMVGHPNESKIFMNGLETGALINTGSMVTCMSKKFYQSLQFTCVNLSFMIFRILNLRYIVQMGGNSLPFSGYVEVELQISFFSMNPIYVPVIVTKETE